VPNITDAFPELFYDCTVGERGIRSIPGALQSLDASNEVFGMLDKDMWFLDQQLQAVLTIHQQSRIFQLGQLHSLPGLLLADSSKGARK
jgi:hypothetical protein